MKPEYAFLNSLLVGVMVLLFSGFVQATPVQPAVDEQPYLQGVEAVPYCVDPAFMPFEQINTAGEHEGIFADFLQLIAEKSGLRFVLVPTESYQQTRSHFNAGKCLLVPGADAVSSNQYQVSDTYLSSQSGFVVHVNEPSPVQFSSFHDKRVGYIAGSDIQDLRKTFPSIYFIEAFSDLDGIRKVASGELDAFVSTMAALDYTLRQQGVTRVKLGDKIPTKGPSFAAHVRAEYPQLYGVINQSIVKISTQERDEILHRWYKPFFTGHFNTERLKKILLLVTTVLIALFLLYMWQQRNNRKLKHEVAQRKKAEEEAQQANRIKGQFLANMSHEIRTPMNAVLGFTHLAQKQEGISPAQQGYLERIEGASQSLLGIINDILDFSKIEAGQLDIESIQFNLHELLYRCRALVEVSAREKNLQLILSIEAEMDPLWLEGDPNRLQQVILNLLSNAVKFTEQGQVVVEVALVTENGGVQLHCHVEDSGIGMSDAQCKKLFSPFTQADLSTARRYGGTGLGLAISKQLVELMGGAITVESALQRGTRFSFCIPVEITTEEHRVEASYQLPDLSGEQILVVEDYPLNQQVVTEILQHAEAEVVVASDGMEAVAQVEEGAQFTLVLMDLQMPKMDGFEATAKIRALLDGTPLPIIAMTANAIQSDRERAAEVGLDDFLMKPIDIPHFYKTVSRYCRAPLMKSVNREPLPSDWQKSLPGLNLPVGLRRLVGNVDVYFDLLTSFVVQGEALVRELKQALEKENFDLARRKAHTLRGAAANIAADALSQSAAKIEVILQRAETIAPELVEQLDAEMKTVVDSIRQLPQPHKASTVPPVAPEHYDMKLKHLQQLLEENDLEAEELFRQLRPLLQREITEEDLMKIDTHIAAFRFQQARQLLVRALDGESHNG